MNTCLARTLSRMLLTLFAPCLVAPAAARAEPLSAEQRVRAELEAVKKATAGLEAMAAPAMLRRAGVGKERARRVAAVLGRHRAEHNEDVRAIRIEAFDSDSCGPAYALRRLPGMREVLRRVREEILYGILSPDERKALEREWQKVKNAKDSDPTKRNE